VSVATGETNHQIARACVSQLRRIQPMEHGWSLVRTSGHIDKILAEAETCSGPALITLTGSCLRRELLNGCQGLGAPCLSVLDPVVQALEDYVVEQPRGTPAGHHRMGAEYFNRIEATDYTVAHDAGHITGDLKDADIIIPWVSRTLMIPTFLYLAGRMFHHHSWLVIDVRQRVNEETATALLQKFADFRPQRSD